MMICRHSNLYLIAGNFDFVYDSHTKTSKQHSNTHTTITTTIILVVIIAMRCDEMTSFQSKCITKTSNIYAERI